MPQLDQAALIAEMSMTITDLRAERDRLLALVERLTEERRERPWWRRRWWPPWGRG